MVGVNFGGVETARKLVEKTLVVGRGKTHSIFELMRPHNFLALVEIQLWWIGNELPNPPKFSPAKVCAIWCQKVIVMACAHIQASLHKQIYFVHIIIKLVSIFSWNNDCEKQ